MKNLYDYLNELYTEGDYNDDGISLEDFIRSWICENFIFEDTLYEEFVNGEFIGTHERSFKIDIESKKIEFYINK